MCDTGVAAVLTERRVFLNEPALTKEEMDVWFTPYDLKRLESYARNLVDYHVIMDMLPNIAHLVFMQKIPAELSMLQSSILIGIGLQYKSVTQLEIELGIKSSQVLSHFNKATRKISAFLMSLQDTAISATLPKPKAIEMVPLAQSLDEELADGASELASQKSELMASLALPEYAIKGTDEDWDAEIKSKKVLSTVSIKKRKEPDTPSKTPTAKWSKGQHDGKKGGGSSGDRHKGGHHKGGSKGGHKHK